MKKKINYKKKSKKFSLLFKIVVYSLSIYWTFFIKNIKINFVGLCTLIAHLIKDNDKNFKGWSDTSEILGVFIAIILLKESIKIKNYLFVIISILKIRAHLVVVFFKEKDHYVAFILKLYYALFAPATANLSA